MYPVRVVLKGTDDEWNTSKYHSSYFQTSHYVTRLACGVVVCKK
jgi:hypothetical protein